MQMSKNSNESSGSPKENRRLGVKAFRLRFTAVLVYSVTGVECRDGVWELYSLLNAQVGHAQNQVASCTITCQNDPLLLLDMEEFMRLVD